MSNKVLFTKLRKNSFRNSLFYRNYVIFHHKEMSELLEIDGSLLEGGGQILRNAISMSAILGIPVKVTKIRAGRSKPGLAAQHLKDAPYGRNIYSENKAQQDFNPTLSSEDIQEYAENPTEQQHNQCAKVKQRVMKFLKRIELVAAMCNAKLNGAAIGSTEIEFRPGKLQSGQYLADTKTAGSITLLLQVALPCALLAAGAGVSLELRGGTNADMAPQIDYLTEVFAYVLKRFRAEFNLTIHRRGYFPKGGGRVTVDIKPVAKLHSVELTERGSITSVLGWSFVAGNLPVKMAYDMADGAKEKLRDFEVKIESYKEDKNHAPDNCNGIVLVCESSTGCVLGADGLGKRGVGAREVGASAGERLAAEVRNGGCVDSHTQDQIIIYMALAEGRSVVRTGEITLHTKTAIHIAELIAKVQFTVEPDGDTFLISCTGLGIVNK